MRGMVIWITGLPGSGKSSVAEDLKERIPDCTILRMDDMRETVTPDPTYSETEREILYRSLVYMAKKIAELGHHVIIDATGNLRRWRELARRIIPEYAEIYLKCSTDECMRREKLRENTHGAPRGVYDSASLGWPVPGINVPYEEPLDPELEIATDSTSREDTAAVIREFLSQKLLMP